MSLDEESVLGEGVAIDAASAPVTLRIVSGLIDAIVLAVTFVVLLTFLEPLLANLNEAWYFSLITVVSVAWFVGIPTTVETLTRGLSLGKLALGLRIVRDDSGPVSVRHAIGRALVGVLEIYLSAGMLAVGASALSQRGKRIGDMLSGTYAMRTRGGRKALPPVMMPPSLAGWAATADVRRLPDGLALTARMFLARAHEMTPEARSRLSAKISGQMAPLVSPAPAQGTHPEHFIAAVLATRRDREYNAGIRAQSAKAAEMARLGALPHGIPDAEN